MRGGETGRLGELAKRVALRRPGKAAAAQARRGGHAENWPRFTFRQLCRGLAHVPEVMSLEAEKLPAPEPAKARLRRGASLGKACQYDRRWTLPVATAAARFPLATWSRTASSATARPLDASE